MRLERFHQQVTWRSEYGSSGAFTRAQSNLCEQVSADSTIPDLICQVVGEICTRGCPVAFIFNGLSMVAMQLEEDLDGSSPSQVAYRCVTSETVASTARMDHSRMWNCPVGFLLGLTLWSLALFQKTSGCIVFPSFSHVHQGPQSHMSPLPGSSAPAPYPGARSSHSQPLTGTSESLGENSNNSHQQSSDSEAHGMPDRLQLDQPLTPPRCRGYDAGGTLDHSTLR